MGAAGLRKKYLPVRVTMSKRRYDHGMIVKGTDHVDLLGLRPRPRPRLLYLEETKRHLAGIVEADHNNSGTSGDPPCTVGPRPRPLYLKERREKTAHAV